MPNFSRRPAKQDGRRAASPAVTRSRLAAAPADTPPDAREEADDQAAHHPNSRPQSTKTLTQTRPPLATALQRVSTSSTAHSLTIPLPMP